MGEAHRKHDVDISMAKSNGEEEHLARRLVGKRKSVFSELPLLIKGSISSDVNIFMSKSPLAVSKRQAMGLIPCNFLY